MELLLVVVGAIIVTALADRWGLQPALIIVVTGIAASFLPGFRTPELDSHVLLAVILPPLLFSAAVNFSFPTFIRNIRPILGLGVALVMVTAFAVAAISAWLVVVPLTFGGALVLGAIVAPPDAVTAVAVGRRLGLPKKVMAVLTGESLINDAAALVLFSVAVAQVTGSHTFITNPALLFGYTALLGSAVGAVLGYATLWIRRSLNNPALETVQGLVAPFAAFLLAENVHASGVLAVVAAGFVVGSGTLVAGYQTRLQERYVWNSLDVLLEAFVFAYIGLHLRFVLDDLNEAHESLTSVGLASTIVLAVVVLIRPLSVFVMFGPWLLSQYRDRKATPLAPPLSGRSACATTDTRSPRSGKWWSAIDRRPLSWQDNVVVSWAGMRGVVTLAAAAAVPVTTASGEPFPHRATIQAIAFAVTVGTVLLQGATLPLLIRRLKLAFSEGDTGEDREETLKAERVVHEAAVEVFAHFRAHPPDGIDPKVLDEIRHLVARQSQDADEMPSPESHTLRAEVFAALYREVLRAQRASLIEQRDLGAVDEEAVRAMLDRLDLQEAAVSARLERRI
ncbi:sodium:proton antiporter [Mycobacterium sp. 050272]|uniref:Sodium:proton exchanger n=1 Tax=Mycolicibacterium aromaticivorans JS19b1 = JCM 16368 TaxID=1440774 RepID=A0A064CD70_9MYCO|nr:sodium:proton antiporter [Mycolicibacterium aromaticivorans]KDE96687.1 sodium:proton exchanger [Mycolicibacterium aromaticivorans JS19b1 = JCM 16368]